MEGQVEEKWEEKWKDKWKKEREMEGQVEGNAKFLEGRGRLSQKQFSVRNTCFSEVNCSVQGKLSSNIIGHQHFPTLPAFYG